MKITCPNCAAEYNISEGKIPPGGLQIKCPKCLHSFLAHRDGSTTSVSAGGAPAGGGLGAMPPPPPPPGSPLLGGRPPAPPSGFGLPPPPPPGYGGRGAVEVVDEIEELDESGVGFGFASTTAMAAADTGGPAADDFDFGFGSPPTAAVAAVERTEAQVEDFDFSFGGGEFDPPAVDRSEAQAEDFDFSFGDAPAPAPADRRQTGSGRLDDLFDDLDDLPAPKVSDPYADLPAPKLDPYGDLPVERGYTDLPGERGYTDLPGERGYTDLPGERGYSGLPGERGHSGLPGERGHSGLPGERGRAGLPGEREGQPGGSPFADGLVAPEDHGVDPDGPLEVEMPHGATSPALAPPDPPSGSQRTKILIIAAAVAATVVLAAGGLMMAGIGPFAPDPPKRRPTRPKVAKKPPKPAPPPKPEAPVTPQEPGEDGMIPTSGATLAEVQGYRDAIGRLEGAKLDDAQKLELIELWSFGALEFPGNARWAENAGKQLGSLPPEVAEGVAGRRATFAAALAAGTEGTVDKVIEHAEKHPDDPRAQYLAGHARMTRGEIAEALKAFEAAVAGDDELLGARRMVGELALKAGDLAKAREALEALYSRAPGAPSVANGLAAIELREGNTERAGKLLEQVLGLEGSRLSGQARSRALLTRARMRLDDQGEKAVADLEAAVRAWPGNLEALDLLSQQHFQTGNYEKALDQLEALRAAKVDSPQIAIKIAQSHEGLGRPERALQTLEKATQSFAKDPTVHSALGDLHLKLRAFQPARDAYGKALEVDPRYQPARLKMAALLVKEAKVDEAIAYLEEARKQNPDGALIRVGIADLNKRLADTSGRIDLYAQAEKNYRAALKIDPSLNDARASMVTTLLAQEKAKDALEQLEHLAKRPDFFGALDYEFARAKQAMGQVDASLAHYEKALAASPDDPEILLYAGSAHFEKAEYDRARELLIRAIDIDSKRFEAHYYVGRVAYAQSRFTGAIQNFKQALELDKRNYVYRYWLGRALEAAGDAPQKAAARQEYDVVAQQAIKDQRLARSLCDVFMRRGKMQMDRFVEWQGAIDDFGRAIKCDGKNPQPYYLRGLMREKTNNINAAIKDLEQAIKRKPDLGVAYAALVKVHLRKTPPNMKKIEQLARKAIKHDDTVDEPHYVLCTMLKERNTRAARGHCERYLELAPQGDYAPLARDLLRNL